MVDQIDVKMLEMLKRNQNKNTYIYEIIPIRGSGTTGHRNSDPQMRQMCGWEKRFGSQKNPVPLALNSVSNLHVNCILGEWKTPIMQ